MHVCIHTYAWAYQELQVEESRTLRLFISLLSLRAQDMNKSQDNSASEEEEEEEGDDEEPGFQGASRGYELFVTQACDTREYMCVS